MQMGGTITGLIRSTIIGQLQTKSVSFDQNISCSCNTMYINIRTPPAATPTTTTTTTTTTAAAVTLTSHQPKQKQQEHHNFYDPFL